MNQRYLVFLAVIIIANLAGVMESCDDSDGFGVYIPKDCASLEMGESIRIGNTNLSYPIDLSIDMTWNGNKFGVVWHAADGIMFARLDDSGRIAEGPSVIPGTDGFSVYPSLVSIGERYAIVYSQNTETGNIVMFVVFDENGVPVSEPTQLTDGTSWTSEPKIANGEDRIGVIWLDDRHTETNSTFINNEIYYTELSMDGESLGNEVRLTNDKSITLDPELINANGGFAAIYRDKLVEKVERRQRLFLVGIGGDGFVKEKPFELTGLEVNIGDPSLAWSGEYFAVVFTSPKTSAN